MGKSTIVNILSGNMNPTLGSMIKKFHGMRFLKYYQGTEMKSL